MGSGASGSARTAVGPSRCATCLPWGPGAAPHLGPLWAQRTAAGTERRERSWKHPAGLTCSSTPTPQELVLDPVQRRARFEGLRYAAALKQQAAQHSTALLHWGALWRQLASPCGAWALRWAGLGESGWVGPASTSFPMSQFTSGGQSTGVSALASFLMTNLDSILKSRDITLPTKVHLVKAMVFPLVMYGCALRLFFNSILYFNKLYVV